MRFTTTTIAIAILACTLFPSTTTALSWPLCETGGAVWVTERPSTDPGFPGANLWWFCDEGINILGNAVDVCIPTDETPQATPPEGVQRTTTCGAGIADALCVLLGFDRAFQDDLETAPAAPGEPVQSLNGQICLRQGMYSDTLPGPEELAALPGEPCEKITRLACIRDIDTMAAATAVQNARLDALVPAPAGESEAETARMAESLAEQAAQEEFQGPPALGGPSGRKLLRV